MKIAFIFPFFRTKDNLLDGPPLSTPLLLGNVKKSFPDVIFEQIDLSKEMEIGVLKNKFPQKLHVQALDITSSMVFDNLSASANFTKDKQIVRRMGGNRFGGEYYIPNQDDMKKIEPYLEKIARFNGLNKFDHYFFSIYKPNEPDLAANILLAMFLKKKFPQKKIIIGGLTSFTNYFYKNINKFGFIDSLVVGRGENSIKIIIENLLKRAPIKKIYNIPVKADEGMEAPDYKSFRNLDDFRFNQKDLENIYQLNLSKKTSNKILFIPYRFSFGCFWGKCKYCSNSYYPNLYLKPIKQIIDELKRLKKLHRTKYFCFYNNNFNPNIKFTKELLREMIDNNLDIIWTDSFNLAVLDDEIIKLLKKAGCIRMDIGLTTLNNKLQKFYNNIIQDNKYLNNLKKINKQGIWTDVNIIANLPFSYSVANEIKILKKYITHIDSVTLNSYRAYHSDIVENHERYKLKIINEITTINDVQAPIYFLEKEFKGSLDKRKKIFVKNFSDWQEFFANNNIIINQKLFYLLGCLYNNYGHKNKALIKKYMLSASKQTHTFSGV